MIVNNTQNQYSVNEVYASKPLKNETTGLSASIVPTSSKIISETGVTKRAQNNTPPNFIKHVYVNHQSASNGSLTESFIRSRASLSPSYMHNEITTRYNMISAIPLNLTQIKKSVERLA